MHSQVQCHCEEWNIFASVLPQYSLFSVATKIWLAVNRGRLIRYILISVTTLLRLISRTTKHFGIGRLFGFCDGLICLRFEGDDNILLWNPHLRESRTLLSFEPNLRLQVNVDHYFVYGFGYDCCTDDYEVVAMLYQPRNCYIDTEVHVYTLRANSWMII